MTETKTIEAGDRTQSGPPEPSVYSFELAQVVAQRDELMEALKALVDACADCIAPSGDRELDAGYYANAIRRIHQIADASDAAIAKAEGK